MAAGASDIGCGHGGSCRTLSANFDGLTKNSEHIDSLINRLPMTCPEIFLTDVKGRIEEPTGLIQSTRSSLGMGLRGATLRGNRLDSFDGFLKRQGCSVRSEGLHYSCACRQKSKEERYGQMNNIIPHQVVDFLFCVLYSCPSCADPRLSFCR
jgi:hypothetical protein